MHVKYALYNILRYVTFPQYLIQYFVTLFNRQDDL